jgi:hypothetical protein
MVVEPLVGRQPGLTDVDKRAPLHGIGVKMPEPLK